MLLGVDFDNTIVRYDRLFHHVAVERGLIPRDVPASKGDVRDYLRGIGGENDWIELQGIVYGVRMHEADPFPGVIEFFQRCIRDGVAVCIVSHKTRKPFQGPDCDLHEAAQRWLREHGFYDPAVVGLAPEQVWFELTKAEKLARIAAAGCTHFIDDLPELLGEASFPAGVERLLFDPNDLHPSAPYERVRSWDDADARLLGQVGSRA
jgi:hypothetical protein